MHEFRVGNGRFKPVGKVVPESAKRNQKLIPKNPGLYQKSQETMAKLLEKNLNRKAISEVQMKLTYPHSSLFVFIKF
jgi:hypothetical protein